MPEMDGTPATQPSTLEYTPGDIARATKSLSNADLNIRDERDDRGAALPEALFERVARALTDTLHGTRYEGDIRVEVRDADPEVDHAAVVVRVTIFCKSTPNVLTLLANDLPQVANYGASLPEASLNRPKPPEGWLKAEYAFYTPKGEAIPDDDKYRLPPLRPQPESAVSEQCLACDGDGLRFSDSGYVVGKCHACDGSGSASAEASSDDHPLSPEAGVAHIDGSSLGNPGPAGVGVVMDFPDGRRVSEEISEPIGVATNNVAEYRALLVAVRTARQLGAADLTVYTDSKLVANQVGGDWDVNDDTLQERHRQVTAHLSAFDSFTIEHISREKNSQADDLAKAGAEANPEATC